MRRTGAAIVLAISLAVSSAAGAQGAHVAILKNVSGSVTLVRNGIGLAGANGMHLVETDRVVTGADSAGGIVFRDGTLLTVGPSSEVDIRSYAFEPRDSRYAFSVYLAKGTAIYSSGKIGKLAPEAVSVSTPRATVGVRGTRFIVTAE